MLNLYEGSKVGRMKYPCHYEHFPNPAIFWLRNKASIECAAIAFSQINMCSSAANATPNFWKALNGGACELASFGRMIKPDSDCYLLLFRLFVLFAMFEQLAEARRHSLL